MKLPRRRFLQLAVSAAALPAVSRIAWAQESYPTRPVRLLVGYAAGGYARHCGPAGVEGHITRKRIASEAGISRDWPSASSARDGPHREGEEP